jgi:hypothetical protein
MNVSSITLSETQVPVESLPTGAMFSSDGNDLWLVSEVSHGSVLAHAVADGQARDFYDGTQVSRCTAATLEA